MTAILSDFSHQQDGTPILLDESYFRSQYPLFLPRFHWEVWSSPNLFLNITSPYTTHQTLLCSLPLLLFFNHLWGPCLFQMSCPNMSLIQWSPPFSTLHYHFLFFLPLVLESLVSLLALFPLHPLRDHCQVPKVCKPTQLHSPNLSLSCFSLTNL